MKVCSHMKISKKYMCRRQNYKRTCTIIKVSSLSRASRWVSLFIFFISFYLLSRYFFLLLVMFCWEFSTNYSIISISLFLEGLHVRLPLKGTTWMEKTWLGGKIMCYISPIIFIVSFLLSFLSLIFPSTISRSVCYRRER